MTANNPVSDFGGVFLALANAIILIGVVTIIVGVALALYLRKKGQK